MEYRRGRKLTVYFVEDDPEESWNEAISHIPKNKWESQRARMDALIQQLANEGRLRNPDRINTESKLPNQKKYYAIKSNKIRAYGWYRDEVGSDFFISHFAFKNKDKLDSKDDRRVVRNWEAWIGDGNE